MESNIVASEDESDYEEQSITESASIENTEMTHSIIEAEELAFGRWPRRLLHVQSMTSYEWQPGNTYGGYREPEYNIVSYTWGRYQLKHGKKTHVKSIGIANLTWKTPRIDSDQHFSVEEFQRMIKNSVTAREKTGDEEMDVHFLWLDIACIDQEVTAVKMSEIGRQAIIFKNAFSACVWLSRRDEHQLRTIISDLSQAARLRPDMPRSEEHISMVEDWSTQWLQKLLKHFGSILDEPWFTSLWTLQEAYLRPHACILSRDGMPLTRDTKGFSGFENLRAVTLPIANVASICARGIALGCTHSEELTTALGLIEKMGIIPILRNNPIALFNSATHRNVFYVPDRVYGIMQVFGYRLGASRPGNKHSKHWHRTRKLWPFASREFTLAELELELSRNLLQDFPVQTHMKIFTSPPPFGQAWRLSPHSEIPNFARISTMYIFLDRGPGGNRAVGNMAVESCCKWSVTTEASIKQRSSRRLRSLFYKTVEHFASSTAWSEFSGQACPFIILQEAWERVNRQKVASDPASRPIHEIALDLERSSWPNSLRIPELPKFPIVGFEAEVSEQNRLAQQLVRRFPKQILWVLLLGVQKTPSRTLGRTYYGILIKQELRRGLAYWRRLGILRWEVFDLPTQITKADEKLLAGKGVDWEAKCGLFG
jgi:hypothetical protein